MALTRLRCLERTASQWAHLLTAPDGSAIPGSALTVAELTLYDWDTGANKVDTSPAEGIINSRDAQDVNQGHDVTIDETGLITWQIQAEDNIIVTPRRQVERHRAMFHMEWTLGSPAVSGATDLEFEIDVENLRKVA